MPNNSILSPMTILVGTILLLTVILSARKFVMRFLFRLFRIIFRPLRIILRYLRRHFSHGGVIRRSGRPKQIVGQSALASIGHVLLGESQIDQALNANQGFEKSHLKYNRMLVFKWMQALDGYIKHHPDLSEDDVKAYFEESRLFFEKDTPIDEDPSAFYEEIEGRHIIEMFSVRDFGCYYFLSGMRRTVNGNVRILTISVSAFLSGFVLFNLYLSVVLTWLHTHYSGFYAGALGLAIEPIEQTILIIASGVLTVLLMAGFTYLHSMSQRHAGRELNDFIIRYFAVLGQQYTAANAECGRMYNNYSTKLEADTRSRPWFLAMEWIAFRLLFIETFARNAIYQVQRNSGFYIFYIPLLFVITLLASSQFVSFLFKSPQFSLFDASCVLYQLGLAFYLSLGVLICVYFYSLHGIVAVFHDALTPSQWNGFSSRRHLDTVARLIGLYNGEIVFQRGKFQPQH